VLFVRCAFREQNHPQQRLVGNMSSFPEHLVQKSRIRAGVHNLVLSRASTHPDRQAMGEL
jgi:hypothetical protein